MKTIKYYDFAIFLLKNRNSNIEILNNIQGSKNRCQGADINKPNMTYAN